MLPISVCIIGKNEEKYLEGCLKCLSNYDWEIIFVDTGSTDNTRQIALKYTKNVYDFVWINDFSAARNFAASKSSRDYILSIDCDEYVQEFDEKKLLNMLRNYPDSSASVDILNLESHSSDYTRSELYRLYPKKYFHWVHPIHEQLLRVDNKPATSFHSGISVIHYGYISSGSNLKEKNTRNLNLLLDYIEKEPDNPDAPYYHYQIGISYLNLRDYENSLIHLTKATQYDVNPKIPWVQELIYYYGIVLLNTNNAQTALLLEGLYEDFCNVPEYIYLMGMIYAANGRYKESLMMLSKVVTMKQECKIVSGVTSYMGYFQLGNVCHHLGKDELAVKYLKLAGNYESAISLLKKINPSTT